MKPPASSPSSLCSPAAASLLTSALAVAASLITAIPQPVKAQSSSSAHTPTPAPASAPEASGHGAAAAAPDNGNQPVTITQILKRPHPDNPAQDVIVQRIDLIPGGSAPPHLHPGMVTGYVISGVLEFQIEGGPLLTLKAGDTFFEPPGSKHLVARNPDPKQKTELVAFVINPKDQPTAQPLKSHP